MFCLAKLQVQTAFVFNDVLKKTKHDLMFCLVAGYTQALSLQEPCVIYYCTPKYVLGIPGFHSLGSLSILEDHVLLNVARSLLIEGRDVLRSILRHNPR